ncbi:nitrous oxide reductase accessory protein NosL [Shewanella sp. Choline-02u-19]|uniref:nitrous oxide reductase accessory protein NosL n=1 Tax=unclassified Shewanella TaxID=196818 RepID=UPI000C345CC0|nr:MULTISPECIES: nitrous oxide reductase accessory protein NosL [unclassified Shewanella]PKH57784.1 nitrous oxide reductase accessory protein NosL [Shewanella sp. Bg11-22]PKI29797.1 nitrous oxide reductase accessory protein NosL [Shewanella sp. Choline-02u-19]
MKKLWGLLLLPLLFACSQDSSDTAVVVAQAIHEHDRCHMCGMMIKKYPGPKGQVHLKGQLVTPKFCSTRDMFNFALQSENQRQVTDLFVHDMATTNWESPEDSAFIDAKTAWYVYGASKKAVMGPAVASFGTKEGALKFSQELGGIVLSYDQIDTQLLAGE